MPSFPLPNHENSSTYFCTGAFPQAIIARVSISKSMVQYKKKIPGNIKNNSILSWKQASPSCVFFQLVWRHSSSWCTVQLFPHCYKYRWDNSVTIHSALTHHLLATVLVSWYHLHLPGKKKKQTTLLLVLAILEKIVYSYKSISTL